MIPLESDEARTLTAYLRISPNVLRFHHSPNETGHSPEARRRAIRVKREGASKGFPDYLIWLKTGRMVAVELKRQKGSAVSKEQREWIEFLQSMGTPAAICKGAQAAIEFIQEQVNVQPN